MLNLAPTKYEPTLLRVSSIEPSLPANSRAGTIMHSAQITVNTRDTLR